MRKIYRKIGRVARRQPQMIKYWFGVPLVEALLSSLHADIPHLAIQQREHGQFW